MALSFSQGLLSSLTNPGFDLTGVGQNLGGLGGRMRANEQAEAEKQKLLAQQQAQVQGMLTASQDPTANLARLITPETTEQQAGQLFALQQKAQEQAGKQGTEAKRQQGIETVTQIASRSDISNPNVQKAIQQVALNYGLTKDDLAMVLPGSSGMEGRERYVTAGSNVFDMQTGTWNTPPNKAEVSSMEAKDIAKLYEKNTPESISGFLKDPTKNALVPLEDTPDTPQKKTAQQKTAQLLATDNTIEVIDNVINRADDVFMRTYPIASRIPGQPAMALETDLATVRANLAFDRLQKMRNESKTGGALGQVSNIELKLLESAVAGLNPASPNFKENMERVRNSYDDFRRAIIGLPPSSDRYMQVGDNLYYKKEGKWFDLGAME